MENPKWSIRKDALTVVLALAEMPKLADGDFGELTRILKKVFCVCCLRLGKCVVVC